MVFLATPHIKEVKDDTAEKLSAILRTDMNWRRRSPRSGENLACVVLISRQFSELRFRIPILSCYETQSVKIRTSGLGRKRRDYVSA
jgi:hypothetical protein